MDARNSHQVLFMDEDEAGNASRSNHTSNHTMSYYQVATPKSPHELSSLADSEEDGSSEHSHPHETAERLKFTSVRRELLDQLNLQILLTHKEMQNIIEENEKVSGQLEVLKIMHNDNSLLEKVRKHREVRSKEVERRIRESKVTTKTEEEGFYYHTRSKGGPAVGSLRFADEKVIDLRVRGAKKLPQKSTSSSEIALRNDECIAKTPHHSHQRNFSSTCATSNSGVVGTTSKGQPIFRRPDGILIVITCSQCGREGFTSAQGIVNHMRLKHLLHYQSQPLAVLSNQVVLPDEDQDPEVLRRFKEQNKSPKDSYLTPITPLPINDKKNTKDANKGAISAADNTQKSTDNLQKLYGKDDFKEILDYVKEAKKDLETIMKYEPEDLGDASNEDEPKQKRRKRTVIDDKNRPAEKKARPDVIHITENHLPEGEKRSRHYNLRAKSKLKSLNRDY